MTDYIEGLVASTREAMRLWGSRGYAELDQHGPNRCKVGVLLSDGSMDVRGRGETWAAAFRNVKKEASA